MKLLEHAVTSTLPDVQFSVHLKLLLEMTLLLGTHQKLMGTNHFDTFHLRAEVPKSCTLAGDSTFSISSLILWNHLPQSIWNSTNIMSFKMVSKTRFLCFSEHFASSSKRLLFHYFIITFAYTCKTYSLQTMYFSGSFPECLMLPFFSLSKMWQLATA